MKRPTWITFDCYDTLVEFPIDQVTRQILGARADGIDVDGFLAAFEALRFETTTDGPYQPYRDVLRETLAQSMRKHGLPYQDADGDALLAAVPTWGPFADVPPALERRRQQCRLAIITNSDDDIMASNVANIGVPIDRVITAEQPGAYKSSPRIFAYALHVRLRAGRHSPCRPGVRVRHRPRPCARLETGLAQPLRKDGRSTLLPLLIGIYYHNSSHNGSTLSAGICRRVAESLFTDTGGAGVETADRVGKLGVSRAHGHRPVSQGCLIESVGHRVECPVQLRGQDVITQPCQAAQHDVLGASR